MSSDQTGITQLSGGLNGAASASLLAQRDTVGILEQEIIDNLPQFPNLAGVQKATVPFGNRWLDQIQPALIGLAEDISNYADGVSTYDSRFEELLNQSGDDPTIVSTVARGLQELNTQARTCQTNAQNAFSLINKFNLDYAYAVGSFDTEATDVCQQLTASGGDIAQLQQQITQFEARLQSDDQTIAEGATKALPGIFEVTVGVFLALESEGSDTKLIKSGIEYIAQAESELKKASDDAKATLQQYASALQNLSSEEIALTVITTVKTSIDNLRADATTASDAVQAVGGGWGAVITYQSSLAAISDLQTLRSTMAGAFQQYVDGWNSLHQMAESFTSIGTMKVSTLAPSS